MDSWVLYLENLIALNALKRCGFRIIFNEWDQIDWLIWIISLENMSCHQIQNKAVLHNGLHKYKAPIFQLKDKHQIIMIKKKGIALQVFQNLTIMRVLITGRAKWNKLKYLGLIQICYRHSAEILTSDGQVITNSHSTSSERSVRSAPAHAVPIHDIQLPATYVALYPYKPQKTDELELKKGSIYIVTER